MTYRVRRAFRSSGFPFLFPKGKSAPTESAVYRAPLRQQGEIADEETLSLRGASHPVRVSALALRSGPAAV